MKNIYDYACIKTIHYNFTSLNLNFLLSDSIIFFISLISSLRFAQIPKKSIIFFFFFFSMSSTTISEKDLSLFIDFNFSYASFDKDITLTMHMYAHTHI